MDNVQSIISSHNKQVLKREEEKKCIQQNKRNATVDPHRIALYLANALPRVLFTK